MRLTAKRAGSILDPVENKLQVLRREHVDGMADSLTEKEAQDLDRDVLARRDLLQTFVRNDEVDHKECHQCGPYSD